MSLTNDMIALTLVSVFAAADIKPVLATPQIWLIAEPFGVTQLAST